MITETVQPTTLPGPDCYTLYRMSFPGAYRGFSGVANASEQLWRKGIDIRQL
jgi:hypothetical protein